MSRFDEQRVKGPSLARELLIRSTSAAKQKPSLRGYKWAGQLPGIDPDRKV